VSQTQGQGSYDDSAPHGNTNSTGGGGGGVYAYGKYDDANVSPHVNDASTDAPGNNSGTKFYEKVAGTFLMIGYSNGFQVWDVTDANRAVEALSVRDGVPVKSVQLLSEPASAFVNGRRSVSCE
jgi:hypothetical protein